MAPQRLESSRAANAAHTYKIVMRQLDEEMKTAMKLLRRRDGPTSDFNGDPLDPLEAGPLNPTDSTLLHVIAPAVGAGSGSASGSSSGAAVCSFFGSGVPAVDSKLCGVNGCPLAKNHPGLCAIEVPAQPRSRKSAAAPAPSVPSRPVAAQSCTAGKLPAVQWLWTNQVREM